MLKQKKLRCLVFASRIAIESTNLVVAAFTSLKTNSIIIAISQEIIIRKHTLGWLTHNVYVNRILQPKSVILQRMSGARYISGEEHILFKV